MTVIEIIEAHLREHGYDGLCNSDGECACRVDDLAPCAALCEECEPGHLAPCDCGDHDWHIVAEVVRGTSTDGDA